MPGRRCELAHQAPFRVEGITVARGETERSIDKGSGKESLATRFFVSSLVPDQKSILDAVCALWGIANSLHWCMYAIFGDDRRRIRKDNSPLNIATVRHAAFNILDAAKTKRSLRRKRLGARIGPAFRTRTFAA